MQITPSQQGELQAQLRKRSPPASVAQRIRIILLLEEGFSYSEFEEQLRVPASTISQWKRRHRKDGLLGLASLHPGQPPSELTAALGAKVLDRMRRSPPDGSRHWSLRKIASVMKVGKNLMARIWNEAELKPHLLERYMASTDPEFEAKAAAIIGLYLNAPENAAAFCLDEKSAMQALDRLDHRPPLSPGRPKDMA